MKPRGMIVTVILSAMLFAVSPGCANAQAAGNTASSTPARPVHLAPPKAETAKPASAENTSAEAAKPAPVETPKTEAAKPLAAKPVPAVNPPLTVVSWGGGYGQAQDKAIIAPFARTSRIKIIRRNAISAQTQIESGADVIDIGAASAARGCRSGALLALDDLELEPGPRGKPPAEDFLDGGRTKCGIASMAWSHVLLVNGRAFGKRVPKRLKDVFNLRRYPGKRAFAKRPRYLLEMALLADGVKPIEVYARLDTYKGVKRALAKLATLHGQIIWLDKPGDAYKVFSSGKAAIVAGFSGRAFRAAVADPKTRVIWDGQIYNIDYWAIPKTSKNREAARRFIRFATSSERLAANARRFPYGPMRKSAVAMTGKHALLGMDLAPHLPTSPQNLRNALRMDNAFWARYGSMMNARFEIWLERQAARSAKRAKRRKSRRRRSRR